MNYRSDDYKDPLLRAKYDLPPIKDIGSTMFRKANPSDCIKELSRQALIIQPFSATEKTIRATENSMRLVGRLAGKATGFVINWFAETKPQD